MELLVMCMLYQDGCTIAQYGYRGNLRCSVTSVWCGRPVQTAQLRDGVLGAAVRRLQDVRSASAWRLNQSVSIVGLPPTDVCLKSFDNASALYGNTETIEAIKK